MELITDYQIYKELLHRYKDHIATLNTNSIIMPETIRSYISKNKLYFEAHPDGILFFIDERKYFNLYYFWNQKAEFPEISCRLPIIVEELNQNGRRDSYIDEIRKKLRLIGFNRIRRNVQVEMRPGDIQRNIEMTRNILLDKLEQKNLALRYCTDGTAMKQVTSLWEDFLDVADVPDDHFSNMDGATILNVENPMGRVVSTIFWSGNSRTNECRHVVTHPDFYKMGLASVLIQTWICTVRQNGVERLTTWINDQNYKSLALFQNNGFHPNGRISVQFILEKE